MYNRNHHKKKKKKIQNRKNYIQRLIFEYRNERKKNKKPIIGIKNKTEVFFFFLYQYPGKEYTRSG